MSEAAASAGFSRWHSDERLTRRACRGDERAFAAIFRRYHQPLYRFCLAIVGDPQDAQDALQNTMVKVLRALPGEERTIELKPWLYRIAHNEAIDLLRRRRETRQLDPEQAGRGLGLAEDAATRERLRRLLADLRELPERQREALVMRELAGLEFEQIGAALGASAAVARQTLYEARQSLRQMEEGREMSCDGVTRALSDGDGRVLRRRDVRAHLRACAGCRAFRDEIGSRRRDLAAISPLPAAAVAGLLQGLAGGSGAASGGVAAALGGGAAKTIGASAAAKGVATVAVAAAVGAGAAERTGVIHLGLPGDGGSKPAKTAPPLTPQPPAGGDAMAAGQAAGKGRDGSADAGGDLPARGRRNAAGGAATPGAAASAPGHDGVPGKGRGAQHGKPAAAATPGPPADAPGARGQGKGLPSAAAGGQGTAAGQKPPPGERGGGDGKATTPAAPPGLPASPGPPAKGAPPNPPPAAAPEPPGQAPPQPESQGSEHAAPGSAAGSGKGSEAGP